MAQGPVNANTVQWEQAQLGEGMEKKPVGWSRVGKKEVAGEGVGEPGRGHFL